MSTKADDKNKRRRTARVVSLLEKAYGVPMATGTRPPLDALVETVLSQSTSDTNSHRAYISLRSAFDSWEKVMKAPVREIEKAIRIGGLSNQKSKRIQEILRWVKKEFGSLDLRCLRTMPPDRAVEMFTQVPGIGIKTISVVLLFSCGKDVFPVDTHVHRICRRLGLVPEKASANKTHEIMAPLVPKGKAYSLHVNLLKLGRTICRPGSPLCDTCPLEKLCQFRHHNQ